MSERVLMIDDDAALAGMVAEYLGTRGLTVTTAGNLEQGEALLKRGGFDVLILDAMLPDGDGFELCNQLHRRSNTPVILLTARDTAADRIRGLDLGADDYVTKPFEPRELVARINSVLRRQGRNTGPAAPSGGPQAYRFAGWQFSVSSATLCRDASPAIQLSTAESRLLQVFLAHPNTLLPRERLIDLTAAADSDVSDRAIDRQVSRLRRKLAHGDATPDLLRTIWGGGYLLAAEVSECAP